MRPASIAVIIPALNEASYLRPTVDAVRRTFAALPPGRAVALEILVVDNGSVDGTAEAARALKVQVVDEPIRSVARARNAGARAASAALLVFLDADTLVPPNFAQKLVECSSDLACLGGAFDTYQRPTRSILRAHLSLWRWLGLRLGMAQGAAQFCRAGTFAALGGYDEELFMGEDVEFYWRLKTLARKEGSRAVFVRDARVMPSLRRFERWPVWKSLLWTNPVVVALLRRRRDAWRGWYEAPPR